MEPTAEITSLAAALINLLPVVGGAVIGVIGGLVGTSYAHRLSRKHSQKEELKKKLERLVTEAYEIDVWLKKQEGYYLFGGEEILEQSPIAKIEAIAALYFPELSAQVANLSSKNTEYKLWLLEGFKQRASSGSAIAPEEHVAKIAEFYDPVMKAKSAIVEEAKCLSARLQNS